MSRRRAPSDLRIPISRVRSATAMSMMFMITIPPTTNETATRPGSARNNTRLIFPQKSSTSSAVSSAKSSGSRGRRWRRLRITASACAIASRMSGCELAFIASASMTRGWLT